MVAMPLSVSRPPICHVVKTWSQFFEPLRYGEKTAELRFNDRDYRRGDTMLHQEYDPERKRYVGRELTVHITAIIDASSEIGALALTAGWVVLSIRAEPNSDRWNIELAGEPG